MGIPPNNRSGIVRKFDSILFSHTSLPDRVFLFDAVLMECCSYSPFRHELVVEFDALRTCQNTVSLIRSVSSSNPLTSVGIFCNHTLSSHMHRVTHYYGSLFDHTLTDEANSMFNPTFVFKVDRTFCIEQGSDVSGYKGENFLYWEHYRRIFKSF